jgi:hypothetical protein
MLTPDQLALAIVVLHGVLIVSFDGKYLHGPIHTCIDSDTRLFTSVKLKSWHTICVAFLAVRGAQRHIQQRTLLHAKHQ